MAVVSIATLKTYFETGDFPTQSQFVDLIDTLNNASTSSYKSYTALMNQSGVAAPIIGPDLFTASGPIVNTLGGTVVWTYISAGRFRGTLAGAFPTSAKTWISISGGGTQGEVRASWQSVNAIEVFSEDSTGSSMNDILNRCSIKIEVYP